MADLKGWWRERAAGEHQLVHEMAALEDSPNSSPQLSPPALS